MDLKALDFTNTSATELRLTHPVDGTELKGDDGKPLSIFLHGADSDKFRKAVRTYGNKKLNQKKQKQTMEEIEATASKLLGAVTESWHNILVDGDMITCTPANAEKLYDEYSWIREQVDEFVNDRANFLMSA